MSPDNMICLAIIAVLVALSYYYLTRGYDYWAKKGVPQSNPWPIVGDIWPVFLRRMTFGEFLNQLYYLTPNSRYFGFYGLGKATMIVKDLDLIKQLAVKDFDHFTDHQKFLPEDADPFWSKNLFALRGQRWKDMRSTLSPAFTSSKMKQMFVLIQETAQHFTDHFLKQPDQDVFEVEMKSTLSKFTGDVIGTVAFGVTCNSFENPDNEFYQMGKRASDMTSFKTAAKIITYLTMPKIAALLGLKMIPESVSSYFYALITKNMKEREENGIVRPDMVHLLMEAKKNRLHHEDVKEKNAGFATVEEGDIGKTNKVQLSDIDITAQALLFFLAGFDSGASTMSFIAYELARNPDQQEKLRQEIFEVDKKCGGEITYEALMAMKYMDMAVSEVLRLWPGILLLERLCTKEFTIQPATPEEVPVVIEKDTLLGLPVWCIHRDPEYFPDPDKFDPERFSDENKSKIKPYSYFPFGVGPRACIGNRLGLLEIKTLFYNILLNFEIVPTEKTAIPLVLSKKAMNMNVAEGGFWLGLKRLKK